METQKQEILGFVAEQRQHGRTVREVLGNVGVPRASYYRWRATQARGDATPAPPSMHRRRLTPEEGQRIDQMHEAYPHLRHRQLQGVLQAVGLYLSASSIYHHLKSNGEVAPYERRPSPMKQPRYEVVRRNLLWGGDWTKLLIGGQRWYLLTVIDFFSRRIVAWRIVPSVDAGCVTAVYHEGLVAQGIDLRAAAKPQLRVDQGSPNTSRVTREFFELLGAALSFSRVRRPTDNAVTERFYGTIKQEEIYLVGNYPDLPSATREIGAYMERYNTQRPHQALWNFTPQIVHDLNNKTEVLKRLSAIKRDTWHQRKEYWQNHQPSDSENPLVLSH